MRMIVIIKVQVFFGKVAPIGRRGGSISIQLNCFSLISHFTNLVRTSEYVEYNSVAIFS